MAWHRSGDKPLSEPMMVNLLMHICVLYGFYLTNGNLYTRKDCIYIETEPRYFVYQRDIRLIGSRWLPLHGALWSWIIRLLWAYCYGMSASNNSGTLLADHCRGMPCLKTITTCHEMSMSKVSHRLIQHSLELKAKRTPYCKVHGANMEPHLGPTGPRRAPCWPHDPCYLAQ